MGKRGNGEGSIRRHGKSWHTRIMDGYKLDGKPNIRYLSGKTQAEVRVKLNKFKQQWDAAAEAGRNVHLVAAPEVRASLQPSYFRDKFGEVLEEIPGMRLLTPHSCRHSYVSHMQALGVDLATIQSIVGHGDLDMTKHYLHVQEPVRKGAADRFSEAFGSETE